MNVAVSANKVLADGQVETQSIRCALIQHDRYLYKHQKFRHKEDHLQTKESLRLQETKEESTG